MPDYEKMIQIHHRELWEEWQEEEEKDRICPECGGDVGHLINCPDGMAFSGDRETIINNPLEKGKEEP